MKRDYCVHPGLFIKSVLMSINKTQKWLAAEMKVNKVIINDIIKGRRNVTPAIADAFQKATGMPAEMLLNQQNKYDLFMLRQTDSIYEIVVIEAFEQDGMEIFTNSFDLTGAVMALAAA